MKNAKSSFSENYHGILTHDGWTKVAKFIITAKILNIQRKTVTVKGKNGKGSYHCSVHKNLLKDIRFMQPNDDVGIKWNMGKPYIVAYRKANYDNSLGVVTGDCEVTSNDDWINFFDGGDSL